MPYLKLRTNKPATDTHLGALTTKASALVAKLLGKPERYVLVDVGVNPHMRFASTDAPLAYLELKSLGLEESHCKALSAALCEFVHTELGIDPDRVYIEFASPSRAMWGWDRGTFG